MKAEPNEVRHVVAWLLIMRWATCEMLWTVIGIAWLLPHLEAGI